MAISIEDYNLQDETHDVFDVHFLGVTINTMLTSTPSMVDSWISNIEQIHRRRLDHLIIGLDIEWRPNNRHYDNPVATLQLCVGRRCLIFQILYAPYIPQSLVSFLLDSDYTFVGVGIDKDVSKLEDDYNLEVAKTVDLRTLAASAIGSRLRNAGLKTLAREVLGKEITKPEWITRSRWDHEVLTYDQIQYACLDAYLSFEIGLTLNASD